jgi:H+/Cl- antiporter ClcA/PII-like signaling protein
MKHVFNPLAHSRSLAHLAKWTVLIVPVAVLAGSASAFFLWALEIVTRYRWQHEWLLFLLPLAGLAVGLAYHLLGKSVEGGNNLIVDQIHEPGGGVPSRMAPLVLGGTLITHLFGGSAGREGTAVQMGGSLASAFCRLFRIQPENMRVVLMGGVAAGFGSVFGTPLTGAVFAMEVLTLGRVQYDALIPVLIGGVVGDLTCSAWGIKHAIYHITFVDSDAVTTWLRLNPLLLVKAVAAGIIFGFAGMLFSELAHDIQGAFKKHVRFAPLRPVIGGLIVIGLTYAIGQRDYLGLGVKAPHEGMVTILSAFEPSGAHTWSWIWKILFTAVTLGSGFKGGEVTPLFFIGATLGNTLAWLLNAPVDLFAGLGFIAVFAGCTNTPLACTIMGIELFGAQYAVYFGTACFIAYFFSGHSGIYLSQRVGVPKKATDPIPLDVPLRQAREISRQQSEMELAGWRDSFRSDADDNHKETSMSHKHKIAATEMGKVRIYMSPTEKAKPDGSGFWSKLNAKPLYREIIRFAKREKLMNAVAFQTHHGFSNSGEIETRDPELGGMRLTMCVELIDHKDKLEGFCREHGELLKGKVIVYKHVEHWAIEAHKLVENEVVEKEKE